MTLSDSRIPVSIEPLLRNYIERLQAEVPDLLLGVYLHGSATYGAFCEPASDIDVLVVTTRTCSTNHLTALAQIHADLRTTWPQWKLEASYVPRSDCGLRPGAFPPHPYHHQNPHLEVGEFVDHGIFDFNSPIWAANLWWMVKTHGIALLGPEPATLGISVSADDIVATSRQLVENYWPAWTRPREKLLHLRVPFDLDWVVFGTLRTYYTLRQRDITSKQYAAEYGLTHLPRRWHWLIHYVLAHRNRPISRGLIIRVAIGLMAALYLRFILRLCRRIIAND